ncbi:centrosomal protein of 192 kDa [Biomphalaria pfeifferi]|uniref:Centrosomal protein of 192 kDa n=1 Tax=Biomphalaria pfeifferi TaxID=112525 RepID=A0AAD8BVT0_BIOPF|nr:centrosomal protein of 192 kDa [Biomphalaria pfeifferi]
MDSINFINDSMLTGAEGPISSTVDDRTIASTPAPLAMSTVGRDRGTRRIFFHENRSSLFSTSPPHQELAQNDAEDSLGLLPPGCLMGMSNSLLPLETINNCSRQGTVSVDSCSSKEISSESQETLATVKKCPTEPYTRGAGVYKPHVLFPKLDEEDMSKTENLPKNDSKDLMMCNDVDDQQSRDSGVGQTNSIGSHMGQTTSRRSYETFKTNSASENSDLLEALKTKMESKEAETFFYSMSRNSADVNTMVNEKSDTKVDSKNEEVFSQPVPLTSIGVQEKGLPVDREERSGSLIDNFTFKHVNIKVDFQHLFSDLGFSKDEVAGKITVNCDSSKTSEQKQIKEKTPESPYLIQASETPFPLMDGPFKLPFLPKSTTQAKKVDTVPSSSVSSTPKSEPTHIDSSATEWEPSIHFGDSFVLQKTESTTEWGPSIQFGDSVHLSQTPQPFKERPHQESNLGKEDSLFGSHQVSTNPFEGFDQELLNGSEDFIEDPDAKANLLEEDMKQFVKDNPFANRTVDVSKDSYRGVEDTFMNMTIGTYMIAGSQEFDSLSSKKYYRERPDIGMPAYSPPANRRVLPILQPSEIYSPVNIRTIKSKLLTSSESRTPVSEATFALEDQSHIPLASIKDDTVSALKNLMSSQSTSTLKETQNVEENVAPVKDKETAQAVPKNNSNSSLKEMSDYIKGSVEQATCPQTPTKTVALYQTPDPLKRTKDVISGSQQYNIQDGSINLTSDMTFNALHRLIEGLDSNMSRPESLILSELNKHLEEKKKVRHQEHSAKPKETQNTSEKVIESSAQVASTETSLFKLPFPVKGSGPAVLKANKSTSLVQKTAEPLKTADHSVRDVSANLYHQDNLSMSMSLSLVECTLAPNATNLSTAGTCNNLNTNNSNSKTSTQLGDTGNSRFPTPSSAIRDVPGTVANQTNEKTLRIQYSDNSTFNDTTMEGHTLSASTYPKLFKQGYLKPRDHEGTFVQGQHILSDITDLSCEDTSAYHTLCPDTSQSVYLHDERGFAYSTPMPGTQPIIGGELQEQSILPMITPMLLTNLLKLPKTVSFPVATCVMLSQEISFPVSNVCERGVKVSVTIREVVCKGQRLSQNCPFDVKPQLILSGNSFQDLQLIFRPREEGDYKAVIELFAVNMIRTQETRVYTLTVTAFAEKPSIKIWPEKNVLNFGILPWGETALQSIKLQNTGQATLPLILSISRKEASMCNFTFNAKDGSGNKSCISFTSPPDAKGSVLAISLPGVKEGEEPMIHTLELYCRAKAVGNMEQKYQERSEHFQALLEVAMDMPINGLRLREIKLQVTVGMYKLHVDKESLVIPALPGNSEAGSLNILNSGNIPMSVDLELTPSVSHFILSASKIVVPCCDKVPVRVTFTPPSQNLQEKYEVYLSLTTSMFCYSVKVIGKVKGKEVKITSSLREINFWGVDLGQTKKRPYTFISHGDTKVSLNLRNVGTSFFKIVNDRGQEMKSAEISVEQGKQYEIWISFCPSELKGYSTDLILKTDSGSKFSVPIRGYGGRSCVEIKDLISQSNEWILNVGKIISGKPVCYEMKIKNSGPRCCFIKTLIKDINGVVFQPFQASILPPLLLLQPQDSAKLMVMIFPSQRENCNSSLNHLATIKLIFVDEINRQYFLSKPGKKGKHLMKKFDFVLPMDNTMKEIINNEMKSLPCHEDTYSVLKNSMFKMNIKVIGQSSASASTPTLGSSQQKMEADYSNHLLPSTRPVLTPLSPNIAQPVRDKDEWTVAPKEVWLNGDVPSTLKQSVQVINFSAQEMRFYTECDDNINVFPAKGVVKPKDTMMLNVSVVNKNLAANWFGLLYVLLNPHNRQVVKVYLTNPVDINTRHLVTAVTTNSHRPSSLPPSPERPGLACKTQSLGLQHPTLPLTQSSNVKIQGSDKAILMTTEAGNKSYLAYNFTNTSQEPLSWKLVPFVPPYVKDADDTHSLYRVDYEVFKLIPLSGTLQPDETEKITIEFSPKSKGYFNQDWSIHDAHKSQASLHNFTILAKGIINPSRDGKPADIERIPEGLSRTSIPSESRPSSLPASPALQFPKPSYTQGEGQTPTARRAEYLTGSPFEKPERLSPMPPNPAVTSERSERSSEQKDKSLVIVEPHVQFSKVPIGGTLNLKICIKNTLDEKVEIVVDYEPKPPFMIKHYNFTLDKGKMMMFPVIFKPRHKGHFSDKLVFKERANGIILTAYLLAEC